MGFASAAAVPQGQKGVRDPAAGRAGLVPEAHSPSGPERSGRWRAEGRRQKAVERRPEIGAGRAGAAP